MSNIKDDTQAKQKSQQAAQKAKQLPSSTQYAIVQVLPNILNGCFWGFTDLNDIKKHYEALKQDKNIQARKLGNACLLEVEPSYLLKAVQMIDTNAINQKDIEVMKKAMFDAEYEFEKFIIRSAQSKSGFGGTIGIYCTNDSTAITYKGTRYPAFRLNLQKVVKYLMQYNYAIQINGKFIPASQAAQNGQALFEALNLSPTNTGAFLNIKYLGTPEQGKQYETQFKAKYGLKK